MKICRNCANWDRKNNECKYDKKMSYPQTYKMFGNDKCRYAMYFEATESYYVDLVEMEG
jgi:hypothetical protein